MSLLIKKILEKVKNIDNKQKTNELNIKNILQNNWEQHYYNRIYKKDNIVYLNLAVKKRNSYKNWNSA